MKSRPRPTPNIWNSTIEDMDLDAVEQPAKISKTLLNIEVQEWGAIWRKYGGKNNSPEVWAKYRELWKKYSYSKDMKSNLLKYLVKKVSAIYRGYL